MSRSIRRLSSVLVAVAALSALAVPAQAVKRVAFATSATGTGNLNSWPEADNLFGLPAGDAICRNLAEDAGLDNAVTFRAWLSTAATDAFCHVRGQAGAKGACTGTAAAAGPWFQVTQLSNFSGPLATLAGPEGEIFRGVLTDENGVVLDSPIESTYWTGTTLTGEATTENCSTWASAGSSVEGTIGDARSTARKWTQWLDVGCDSERRLLCFEPGASEAPIPVPWAPAALVFTTSASGNGNLGGWAQAGGEIGLAAGDEICRNLATAAHLPAPASFVAWLSDATVDAGDRLTLTNATYRRVDHYIVADSKADLLDGTNDNSLHVNEHGDYLTTVLDAFTATDSSGAYLGTGCSGWTVTSGSVSAGSAPHQRTGAWTNGVGTACLFPGRIYCFSNVVTLFWDGFDLSADSSRWSSVVP